MGNNTFVFWWLLAGLGEIHPFVSALLHLWVRRYPVHRTGRTNNRAKGACHGGRAWFCHGFSRICADEGKKIESVCVSSAANALLLLHDRGIRATLWFQGVWSRWRTDT